jgi:hypothetical protein
MEDEAKPVGGTIVQTTADKLVPVPEGVKSMGDVVQAVFNARIVDPFIYCVSVQLSHDSTPHGTMRGMVSILQLPKINPQRPDEWYAFEVYECPTPDCRGILTDEIRKGLYWMCPKCHGLATVDDDLIPKEGLHEGVVVRKVWRRYFAFGAEMWGDVLAEYVQRLWDLRKTSDQTTGYRAMVLLRRPRLSVQKLTNAYLDDQTTANEDKLLKARSTQSKAGLEYAVYGPDAIEKDLESGTSLAKRLEVFMRGGG